MRRNGGEDAADFDDEHDGVLHHGLGGELDEGVCYRPTGYRRIEQGAAAFGLTCGGHDFSECLEGVAGVEEQVLQDGAEGERGEEC